MPFAAAPGPRSTRSRPGPAMDRRAISLPLPGPVSLAATSLSPITPAAKANAGCHCRFRTCPARTDLMGTEIYDRAGSDLAENGLYIDHAPWHRNVFELRTL